MEFVRDYKDLIITGPIGTGKSYLATWLGYKICQDDFRVIYASMAKLMSQLKISKAKGTMRTELKRIERADLLIPDDFCMQPATRRPVSWGILMGIIDNDHIVDSRKRLYDAIGEKHCRCCARPRRIFRRVDKKKKI